MKRKIILLISLLIITIVYAMNKNEISSNKIEVLKLGAGSTVDFAVMGDSISTFRGWTNIPCSEDKNSYLCFYPPAPFPATPSEEDIIDYKQMYWYHVAAGKNWNLKSVEAISSTHVSCVEDADCMASDTRIARLGMKSGGKLDKIIVFGGVNDAYTSGLNIDYFSYYYVLMLNKMYEKYPGVQIILLNPYIPKDVYEHKDTGEQFSPLYIEYFNNFNAVRAKISEIYSNYKKNNYNIVMVDLKSMDTYTHPNRTGMKQLANLIINTNTDTQNSGNNPGGGTTSEVQSSTANITMSKNNVTSGNLNCDTLFGTNTAIGKFIHDIYNIIKFAVPIILLALSIKDFASGIASQDGIKKASNLFIKRLIIAIIILILPTILNYFLDLLEIDTCFL